MPDARTSPQWYQVVLALALMLIGLIPGIAYAIYVTWQLKRDGQQPACTGCGHRALVPAASPEGKRLAAANVAS